MNNPQNPLVPQGSLLEQKNQGRARVKIAVFVVLAIHGIGLMALLMAGCRREEPQPAVPETIEAQQPPADTNSLPPFTADQTNQLVGGATGMPVDTNLPPMTAPGDTNITTGVTPPVTPVTPTPEGTTTEYTVTKGDTFAVIAKKFHVTTKALIEANPGVEPTKLQINQKIKVPAPTATATTAPTTTTATGAAGTITYVVKSGDTLSSIATKHKTTVNAIRKANNLKTDALRVDQKLKIPVKAQ